MLEKGRACRTERSKAYLQLGRYIIFLFSQYFERDGLSQGFKCRYISYIFKLSLYFPI